MIKFRRILPYLVQIAVLLVIFLIVRSARKAWRLRTRRKSGGMTDREKDIQTLIACLFHALFIMLGFELLGDYPDGMLVVSLISEVLYLGWWIASSRKSYMPWSVYRCFLAGTVVETALNATGIIPPDGGFFSGLGQLFYILLIIIHTVIIGITNLILYKVNKPRRSGYT